MTSRTSPSPTATAHEDTGARPLPGWRLTFAAGFVPLTAGLVTLLTLWLAVARADSQVWTGLGYLDFTYARLSSAGVDADAWVQLIGSVGGVNVAAAAVAVIVVSRFALRDGQAWAWWFLAFCLLWVGLHDAVMATRFFLATGAPVMLLPYTYVALMTAGLIRTRGVVLNTRQG
jgi:hypothetical protein